MTTSDSQMEHASAARAMEHSGSSSPKVALNGLVVLLAVVCVVGCKQDVEVHGEVFSLVYAKPGERQVVREPGTVVFILTESENTELLKLAEQQKQSIRQQYAGEERERLNKFIVVSNRLVNATLTRGRKPNSLVRDYRSYYDDPRSDDEILVSLGSKNPSLFDKFPDARGEYEELLTLGSLDQRISSELPPVQGMYPDLFEPTRPPVSEFLRDRRSAVADSEGRFKLTLERGRTYFIVAQGSIHEERWHFKFVAEGQKLVLSEGNKKVNDWTDP